MNVCWKLAFFSLLPQAIMASSIDQLIDQLRQPDLQVQSAAAEQLSRLGEAAAPAAAALAVAAGSDDEELREFATSALEDLGAPPIGLQSELQALLGSENDDTAYWAATLLGRLGNEAADSAVALAKLLNSARSPAARERAAWALGKIGVGTPTVRESLQAALQSDAPRLAREAQRALDAIQG